MNLAELYKNQGNLEKAEEFHKKSLKIIINLLGEDHSDTSTSYDNLALLYRNKGNLEKAEEFHNKSLKIRKFIRRKSC